MRYVQDLPLLTSRLTRRPQTRDTSETDPWLSASPVAVERQARYRLGRAHPWRGGPCTRGTTDEVSWSHRNLHSPSTSRAWSLRSRCAFDRREDPVARRVPENGRCDQRTAGGGREMPIEVEGGHQVGEGENAGVERGAGRGDPGSDGNRRSCGERQAQRDDPGRNRSEHVSRVSAVERRNAVVRASGA